HGREGAAGADRAARPPRAGAPRRAVARAQRAAPAPYGVHHLPAARAHQTCGAERPPSAAPGASRVAASLTSGEPCRRLPLPGLGETPSPPPPPLRGEGVRPNLAPPLLSGEGAGGRGLLARSQPLPEKSQDRRLFPAEVLERDAAPLPGARA